MTDAGDEPLFTDGMTLGEARAMLRRLVRDGHRCPCCTQLAKIYRRNVNAGMAHSLILMWRRHGLDWQHVPTTIGRRSAEEGKLAYWGLVEEEKVKREDGGRAGWWRVTELGQKFVERRVSIPKYALVYDGRPLRLEGPQVWIADALGARFDYEELMNG